MVQTPVQTIKDERQRETRCFEGSEFRFPRRYCRSSDIERESFPSYCPVGGKGNGLVTSFYHVLTHSRNPRAWKIPETMKDKQPIGKAIFDVNRRHLGKMKR